jgi:hypothetical protein
MKPFAIEGSSPPSQVQFDTSACFDLAYASSPVAAIDQFFVNHQRINQIATPTALTDHPDLGGLALLGSVSAVESYFREVIRRIILLDPQSRSASHSRPLTYGATWIHDREMLPEALLEDTSFSSKSNIEKAIKDLLGITQGFNSPTRIALEMYDNLCQLRHCAVHRFGKLGSRNAMKLGLDDHSRCVEKPLRFTYGQVQEMFAVNHNAVKVSNNFLFSELLRRAGWSWDYRKDRRRFGAYWSLFASAVQPPAAPANPRDAYNKLRSALR